MFKFFYIYISISDCHKSIIHIKYKESYILSSKYYNFLTKDNETLYDLAPLISFMSFQAPPLLLVPATIAFVLFLKYTSMLQFTLLTLYCPRFSIAFFLQVHMNAVISFLLVLFKMSLSVNKWQKTKQSWFTVLTTW